MGFRRRRIDTKSTRVKNGKTPIKTVVPKVDGTVN